MAIDEAGLRSAMDGHGSLAEKMTAALAAAGDGLEYGAEDGGDGAVETADDREAQASSEEGRGPGEDVQEASGDDHPSEDGGDDRAPRRDPTVSELVRRNTRLDRDLGEARRQLRTHQEEIARLRAGTRAAEPPRDLHQHMLQVMGARLGVDPKDPRVLDALYEYAVDVSIEKLGDKVDEPTRRYAEERRAERARQREIEELREGQRQMREERDRAAAEAQRANDIRTADGWLGTNAARFPHLIAQREHSAAELIVDRFNHEVSRDPGLIDRTDARTMARTTVDLLTLIAETYEGHYAGMADQLLAARQGKTGAKSAKSPASAIANGADRQPQPRDDGGRYVQRDARTRNAGRGGGSTGGGGRGRVDAREDREETTRLSLQEKWERAQRANPRAT